MVLSEATQKGTRPDAKANRARLLEAARLALIEKGLDVDVREIAARAGVGLGTFYRNFGSKEQLIGSLVEEIASEFDKIVDRALAQKDAGHGWRLLINDILAFVDRYGRSHSLRHRVGDSTRAHQTWNRVRLLIARALDAGHIDRSFGPDFVLQALLAISRMNYPDEATGEHSQFVEGSRQLLLRGLSPPSR
jgi:AcrR family transcriptional regulator